MPVVWVPSVMRSERVVAPVPPLATGSVPVTPVVSGRPVKFVATPEDGVPSAGVTSVGEFANTSAPLPVSSVTAVMRFALDGVASQDAIPAASPLIPVDTGRPVAFVSTAEDGVPSAGVTRVGLVERTILPVPVTEFERVTPPYVSAPESVVPLVTASAFAESVVPSNVRFDESWSRPPVPAYVTRPLVRLVAVRNGEESAPVEAIVVVPVCPAAKVFAESVPAKNAVDEAFVNESADGRERVSVPSPSSVTVIWLAVPAIQLVSEETAETMPELLSERRREGVKDWSVVAPETLRAVVEAVPK